MKSIEFKSSLEEYVWEKIPSDYKSSVEYEGETLEYYVKHNYKPDLVMKTRNDKKIYIEIKGYLRREDMIKMIAVKKTNPSLDIRFVFEKDNKVSGAKKLRYSGWSEKNGFPYAFNSVPEEWLSE